MKGSPRIAASLAWACLWGGLLGALRTREAALHLLAKNRALEALGVPALPGAGHWDTMISWRPAGAGALFYALGLGLGAGVIVSLWVLGSRGLPGAAGRWAPWACLAGPMWALGSGDPSLAGTAAALCLGTLFLLRGVPVREPAAWWLRAVCCAVLAVGFVPWARAPEGVFTRFRDRVLFRSEAGLAVNRFYYRWTLYPAEALKPLASETQPTVVPTDTPSRRRFREFCADALAVGLLCLPAGSPGADLGLAGAGEELQLRRSGAAQTWAGDAARRREAWKRFSAAQDPSRPLRRATGWALFSGCPLGLLWLLGSGCARLGGRIRQDRLRAPTALVLSAFLAAGSAFEGTGAGPLRSDVGSLSALRERLESPDPLDRLHGVRMARHLGAMASPLLLESLGDPLINVRYAAVEALGFTGGVGVVERLLTLLKSPEEWYVKERAYGALWRLGWRPPSI